MILIWKNSRMRPPSALTVTNTSSTLTYHHFHPPYHPIFHPSLIPPRAVRETRTCILAEHALRSEFIQFFMNTGEQNLLKSQKINT